MEVDDLVTKLKQISMRAQEWNFFPSINCIDETIIVSHCLEPGRTTSLKSAELSSDLNVLLDSGNNLIDKAVAYLEGEQTNRDETIDELELDVSGLERRVSGLNKALSKERDSKDQPTFSHCIEVLVNQAKGCQNFLTYTVDKHPEQWEITVKKCKGKSPDEAIGDLRDQLATLLFENQRLRKAIEENL